MRLQATQSQSVSLSLSLLYHASRSAGNHTESIKAAVPASTAMVMLHSISGSLMLVSPAHVSCLRVCQSKGSGVKLSSRVTRQQTGTSSLIQAINLEDCIQQANSRLTIDHNSAPETDSHSFPSLPVAREGMEQQSR